MLGSRALLAVVGAQLLAYALFAVLVIDRSSSVAALTSADAFWPLLQPDLPALLLLSLVGVLGFLLSRFGRPALAVLRWVESAPWLVAGTTTVLCALLAWRVVGARPLAMDEVAPLYQARLLSHGQVYATVAPDAIDWLFFPRFTHGFFTANPATGRVVSFYWPGLSLAMAPFEAFGAGFLLNPVLAGGSVLLMRKLALALGAGDRELAGTAMLLLVCAPEFTLNAATYYSMNAQLFAHLAFVWLLLEPTRRRLLGAGLVGSWALATHNPFPHVVFALPWLAAQLWRPDRVRRLTWLGLGYLPLTLLLVVGWHFYRHGFLPPRHGVPGVSAQRMLAFGFELPSADTATYRALGLGKLMAWCSFGLLPLAVLGAYQHRSREHVRPLIASGVLALLAYLITPYSQGHGWGYRYFHPAFLVLPLLGALGLRPSAASPVGERPAADDAPAGARLANLWWMLGALALCLPQRALQVRDFMEAHYRQRNPAARAHEECVHFLRPSQHGSYVQDLIWNDPWLRGRDVYLTSHGDGDARLLAETSDHAELRASSESDVTYCARSLAGLRARLIQTIE